MRLEHNGNRSEERTTTTRDQEDAAKRATNNVVEQALKDAQQAAKLKEAGQDVSGDFNSSNGAVEGMLNS